MFAEKKYKGVNIAIIASDHDKVFANEMIKIFKNCGIVCWSSENLLPGQDWALETRKACRNAKYVFLLVSNAANEEQSEYQQFIRWALEMQGQMPHGGVKTIPTKIESCNTPEHLMEYQPIEPTEKEWNKIKNMFEKYLEA